MANIGALAVQISANPAPLANGLAKAQASVKAFDKSVKTPNGLAGISDGLKSVTAGASAASGGIGSMMGMLAGAGPIGAGLAAAGALLSAATAGVQLSASAETAQMSFKVLLGDAGKAKKMMTDIQQFAASTPFGSAEIIDSAKQLLSFGESSDQVMNAIGMLGDISALTNVPLKDMTYLFGTLKTQGRAYTRDINQFAQRGVKIWEALSDVLGIPVEQVKAFGEEGKIGFSEVAKALGTLTGKGGLFSGGMAELSQSLEGKWSTFMDNSSIALTKFGDILVQTFSLKGATDGLITIMNAVAQGVGKIGPVLSIATAQMRGLFNVWVQQWKVIWTVAEAGWDILEGVFPDLASHIANVVGWIEKVANGTASFEVDLKMVRQVALTTFTTIARPIAMTADTLIWLGRTIDTYVIKPVQAVANIGRPAFDSVRSTAVMCWNAISSSTQTAVGWTRQAIAYVQSWAPVWDRVRGGNLRLRRHRPGDGRLRGLPEGCREVGGNVSRLADHLRSDQDRGRHRGFCPHGLGTDGSVRQEDSRRCRANLRASEGSGTVRVQGCGVWRLRPLRRVPSRRRQAARVPRGAPRERDGTDRRAGRQSSRRRSELAWRRNPQRRPKCQPRRPQLTARVPRPAKRDHQKDC